jgi:hypothetical protein
MYKLRYLLTPEIALLDSRRNQVTAVNIMEDAMPVGFPFVFANFAILLCIERDATDDARPPARLKLIWHGSTLFEGPLNIDFQGVLRTRALMDLHGVVVDGPGTLTLVVSLGDIPDFASTTLDVLAPRARVTAASGAQGLA